MGSLPGQSQHWSDGGQDKRWVGDALESCSA